jgi:hypothetical protein
VTTPTLADFIAAHIPTVHIIGYGGARIECACGWDSSTSFISYTDHLAEALAPATATTLDLPKVETLQIVSLHPGDVIVARVARRDLTAEQAATIKAQLGQVFSHHEVVVLSADITLEATTRAQQE